MSTQLILYPQNNNGQYNAISNIASEKLVDGITFSSINTSASYDSPTVDLFAAVLAAPPNIVNTWYRFRSTATGTPTLPTQTGGNLYLNAVATNTISGVYQRLSNLTIAQSYNVYVTLDNTAAGTIHFLAYNGNLGNSVIASAGYTITAFTAGFAVFNFTAVTTQDFIQFTYTFGASQTFKITGVSVLPVGIQPNFADFSVSDGQVICDLYQEEDIPLTISIDDFKNVAEQVQSYSKDFSLPATKRNNLIFNNMFEVTRADDGLIFNPYVRTQCVLKQDGFILFQGYLRMIDVQDKEGEISYSVNLYSEVIALADILKERTFSDLDFTELKHEYNKSEIKHSWNVSPDTSITYINSGTSGFREAYDTLRYPFIDWTGSIGITTNTSTISGPTPNNPELTSLEQAFRPCIQLKYLINRIFEQTPFTWASNFFDSADFKKLYMDFNWSSNDSSSIPSAMAYRSDCVTYTSPPIGTSWQSYELNYGSFDSSVGYDITTFQFVAPNNNTLYYISYSFGFQTDVASPNGIYLEWVHKDASGTIINTFNSVFHDLSILQMQDNRFDISGTINVLLQQNETLEALCYAVTVSEYRQNPSCQPYGAYVLADVGGDYITDITLSQLRGELGQWDFLKGIMTMFNLVSVPDDGNPNNILIEPYGDVFIKTTGGITLADRSIQYDWTDKVDASQMQLTPLTDLNKMTVFKFIEDDDDYVFNLYLKSTSGHLYGSKVFDASGFTILEGIKEVIAEPFAATVSKPLFEQFSQFIIPVIYARTDEGTYEGFDNSPRIFYNNGKISTGASYYIPPQNGLTSENQTNFLQFSHLSDIPTVVSNPPLATDTRDFVFESSQLFDPIGNPPTNNLFNNYWLPYYAELYNADTRMMTLKVNLTPSDINVFKMTDTVMIKNRSFRVNKIEYKPNDLATVEFILIP